VVQWLSEMFGVVVRRLLRLQRERTAHRTSGGRGFIAKCLGIGSEFAGERGVNLRQRCHHQFHRLVASDHLAALKGPFFRPTKLEAIYYIYALLY
jgi:hypothetical protein